MTKYMTFESQSFANGDLLIEALAEIGFDIVTQGKDLELDGWDKRNARSADIIIRRKDVKSHHLSPISVFRKLLQDTSPLSTIWTLNIDLVRTLS